MAVVVPPSGPPPSGTASGAGTVAASQLHTIGEVVVEQVPDRIAQLARTILLSGTIIDQQAGGALVLRTQIGEVIIRSQTPLPLNQVLTLQIPPGAPPVRAQVSVVQAVLEAALQSSTPPVYTTPSTSPLLPPVSAPAGATPQSATTTPAQPVAQPATQPAPTALVSGSAAPIRAPVGLTPSLPLPPAASPTTAPITARPAISAVANTTLLQAITEAPLLPGSVIPAQVLAVPDFVEQEFTAKLVLPPAVEVLAELQRVGAPALRALLPQGLADVVAKLPLSVLTPPPATESAAAVQPVLAQGTPAAPSPSLPAFSNLPVLLTLPPGSQVTVQVIAVTPAALPASVPTAVTNAAPVPPVVVPENVAAPSPSQPVQATLRAIPVSTPTAPAPMANTIAQPIGSTFVPVNESEPAAPTFTAVIVGHTAQHEPIATSPAGLFVLESKSPIPVGSKVELALVHVTEPLPEAEGDSIQHAPRDWQVLQQAMSSLAGVPTPIAAHFVKPEAMASSVLFLMAALKLGSVQKLVGDDTIELLQARGEVDLLTRMTGEFQQIGQSFNRPEAPVSEWRTLMLPLHPQGQFTRLAIHTRHEREADGAIDGPLAVKRLVVELELSRLGPMLLDGYIRQKKFDLTLRSQRRLDRGLKDELRLAYRDSLTALGWNGGLEFQTAAELWLKG